MPGVINVFNDGFKSYLCSSKDTIAEFLGYEASFFITPDLFSCFSMDLAQWSQVIPEIFSFTILMAIFTSLCLIIFMMVEGQPALVVADINSFTMVWDGSNLTMANRCS